MELLAAIIQGFIQPLLSLILLVFFIYVILSWLFILNIVSPQNPTARQVHGILSSVVEPIVAPFRKIIPPLGNLDMGFFFAALLIIFINGTLIPSFILPALR